MFAVSFGRVRGRSSGSRKILEIPNNFYFSNEINKKLHKHFSTVVIPILTLELLGLFLDSLEYRVSKTHFKTFRNFYCNL